VQDSDTTTDTLGAATADVDAPTPETPAGAPASTDTNAPPAPADERPSTDGANPLADIRSLFDELRDGPQRQPAAPATTETGTPGGDPATGATAPAKEAEKPADDTATIAAKDGEAEKPGVKAGAPREFRIELPDGTDATSTVPREAKITYKAGGQEVTHSLEQVVANASKGVYADQRLSQLGQERAEATRRATTAEQTLATLRTQHQQAVEASDKLLLSILTDDAAYEAAQAEFGKFADPEIQALLQQKRDAEWAAKEKDATQQAEAAAKAEQQDQAWDGFWAESVPEAVTAKLAEYDYLSTMDVGQIAAEFHRGYSQAFEAEVQRLSSHGLADAVVERLANEVAINALTNDALYAVMDQMNTARGEKIAPKLRGAAPGPDPEAVRRANEHNDRTEKLLQANLTGARPLGSAGGGGLPAEGVKPTVDETDSGSFADLRSDVSAALWGTVKSAR
jgi:hypothetical protein